MTGGTQFRRLVLMFDGTWNERHNLTNVARMFEAIDDQKPDPDDELVAPEEGAEPVQLVKYLKGVGTKWLPIAHYLGGAVGYGLSDIINEGYLWLSNNYRDGDEIFVFGFSRGAYSARSLVSLVHRCGGVLKPEGAARTRDDHVLRKAYELYRGYVETPVETTDGANAEYQKQLKEFGAKNCQHVTIKMLGVWDTVGALGIPDSAFKIKAEWLKPVLDRFPFNKFGDYVPWSRKHYVFHGQNLPCIVENAYHALAIDEHREDFEPTLWDERTPKNKDVKQKWFIGSHCNVGGGATNDDDDDPDDLWQYSYVWMQKKAANLGLRFYWTYTEGKSDSKNVASVTKRRVSKTKPQDSFGQMAHGMYAWTHKPFHRDVVGSMGASLHWSVKERILQDRRYQPKSLEIGDKKYRTEIPAIPLPTENCSCEKYNLDTAAATGPPTKKDS